MDSLLFVTGVLRVIRARQGILKEQIVGGSVSNYETYLTLKARLRESEVIEDEVKSLLSDGDIDEPDPA